MAPGLLPTGSERERERRGEAAESAALAEASTRAADDGGLRAVDGLQCPAPLLPRLPRPASGHSGHPRRRRAKCLVRFVPRPREVGDLNTVDEECGLHVCDKPCRADLRQEGSPLFRFEANAHRPPPGFKKGTELSVVYPHRCYRFRAK